MPSPTSTFAKTRGRTWGARGQDAPEKWGGLQATRIQETKSLMPARRALSGPKRGRPDRTGTAGPLSTPGFVLVRVRSFGSGVSWRPPRVRPPRGLSPSQTESPKGREHRVAGGGGVLDPSLIRRHDTNGRSPSRLPSNAALLVCGRRSGVPGSRHSIPPLITLRNALGENTRVG